MSAFVVTACPNPLWAGKGRTVEEVAPPARATTHPSPSVTVVLHRHGIPARRTLPTAGYGWPKGHATPGEHPWDFCPTPCDAVRAPITIGNVLVLIRMIYSLVVVFTLLLSLVAITSPVTGPVEKAALLAFIVVMAGSEAAVWRLTRPAGAAS
jgi:hypothetical protein